MTILYLLVPLAVVCGAAAVAAFVWAVESGQLDDLETPAVRLLTDDERLPTRGPDGEKPGER